MSVVYVCEQGAVIKKSGHRLIVENDGEAIMDMPAIKVGSLLLFGNVQLTTQAIAMLFEHNIDVAFFSQRGRLRGQLAGNLSKNI